MTGLVRAVLLMVCGLLVACSGRDADLDSFIERTRQE